MAKYLGFDTSYISRIVSGQRKPSDTDEFIDLFCDYIIKTYSQKNDKVLISKLIDIELNLIEDDDSYYNKLQYWLLHNKATSVDPVNSFLKKLDEFKLDEYIKVVHFDTLKVPTMPFHFPSSKNYYGLKEMKSGELDFFKTTVLSKTKAPIFMYNDMPMEDMAEDVEFGKKWMFAIACSLKKGLHLNMIHNLDRPFNELMLGLESWIPIYMTGQISPYYFKKPTANIFCHTLYVSEVIALSGEGLKDYHNKSKYYLTSKKNELPYYQEKANTLLKKASPLMDIYTKDNIEDFNKFIESERNNDKNIITDVINDNLKNTFKNIKFTVCKDKWIMLSKKTNPEIHFVIYHPTLRDAIEKFVAPIIE